MTAAGEQQPEAIVAAVAAESKVVRVMVIDDELAGMTSAHLTDLTDNIAQVFGDLTSPELEELWKIVMHVKGFAPLDVEEPGKVLTYVASNEFVQEILLSNYFRDNASPLLTEPLANFLERVDLVATLRSQVEAAFPAPAFETTFVAARPSHLPKLNPLKVGEWTSYQNRKKKKQEAEEAEEKRRKKLKFGR